MTARKFNSHVNNLFNQSIEISILMYLIITDKTALQYCN